MKRISKPEAAEILGCAERQIQRYAQAGKLSVEYVQEGKIRKALYLEAEVLALKKQQETPELRGIAVRQQKDEGGAMKDESEKRTPIHPSSLIPHPLALPQAALQVLQMLGATSGIEAGKCVSVEEMSFDRLSVGADGSTKMSGVSVSRYSARA